MLVFTLEAAPAAGSSGFHILDSSTNNFLDILLIVIFFINFGSFAESSIEYLKLIGRSPKQDQISAGVENNCRTRFLRFFWSLFCKMSVLLEGSQLLIFFK